MSAACLSAGQLPALYFGLLQRDQLFVNSVRSELYLQHEMIYLAPPDEKQTFCFLFLALCCLPNKDASIRQSPA